MFQYRLVLAYVVCAFCLPTGAVLAQDFDAVVVQGQPTPAIYTIDVGRDRSNNPFEISAIGFDSGTLLPPQVINAIQWTDPFQPPPDVMPPLFFYQVLAPGPMDLDQLLFGNHFGAMGFIDGMIDLNQPQPIFNVGPAGNIPGPGDQIRRAQQPPPFQNTIIYEDPQPQPDGLNSAIIVGLALPQTFVLPRGILTYGEADPLTDPLSPLAPGGNDEFVWIPAPAVPDPCNDDSIVTEEVFEYLREQETKNGINIRGETEVVNSITSRDNVTGWVEADDGFTYVTVVEDFVTTQFYRFPTGTLDPKGNVPFLLFGDANNDLIVSGLDLIAVQEGFGVAEPGQPTGMLKGDANDDGFVSGLDLITVQERFGVAAAPVAIPEPSAGLVWVGLALLGRRRAHGQRQ